MNRVHRQIALALAALLVTLTFSACGGGGGGDSSAVSTSAPPDATAAGSSTTKPESAAGPKSGQGAGDQSAGSGQGSPWANAGSRSANANHYASAHFAPRPHHDSGGGAKQFEVKGGDNSIQESGSEASGAEITQAAAALHGYLDARAAHAWRAACSHMAAGLASSLGQLAGSSSAGKQPSCAQLLASLSAGLPPAVLREAAVADVGALRVEGSRAFILFHGAHGTSYFMPMSREGGGWKVAAIAPSALG